MDWEYILSISHDNLSEDEKDKLYNNIAWLDYDNENLNRQKLVILLKISQEIMKYKTEQVEALLAELDEIAAQQGEEETRQNELLDDAHSIKSKKSLVSLQYEDLEHKYKDVRLKLKTQIKTNEGLKTEFEKLQANMSDLQQENLQLQNELRSALSHGDESQSDLSESVMDQHRELVHAVQQKNTQIAQLLDDVEEIETENQNLKSKMSSLRDELQDATNQVTLMTNELSSLKVKYDDELETIKTLRNENEALHLHIQDFAEEKVNRETQIDQFTLEIDARVDEWKRILQKKDEQIRQLNEQARQTESQFSEADAESIQDNQRTYTETLNKLAQEREEQISELQMQLHCATGEMEKSTRLLEQLTLEKNTASNKIDELSGVIKDMKHKLQVANERCRDLQENVAYAEGVAESKQQELDGLINSLKEEGQIELSELLNEVQKLKSQIRIKNKQVSDYIKIANKLQNTIDDMENENNALRIKCGIADDEEVNIGAVLLRKSQQTKEIGKLKRQIIALEDEILSLKSKNQVLNRKISSLSSEILEVGTKSSSEEIRHSHSTVLVEEESNKDPNREKELLEENEALRKGLHEILESVHAKNESSKKEIRSETLEKLLKALDVRHISGWYHPAMRLQAELHSLQGVNSELRKQLKAIRLQECYQSKEEKQVIENGYKNVHGDIFSNISSSNKEIISKLNDHLLNVLNDFHKEKDCNRKLVESLEEYKKKLNVIELQINMLYDEYASEQKAWDTKEKDYEKDKTKLEENVCVLDAKLNEFLNMNEEDFKKTERVAEMSANLIVLNRKCVFLENQAIKLSEEVKRLTNDLANAQIVTIEKINKLRVEKKDLQLKIITSENLLANTVNKQIATNLQNNLDSMTLKYRNLLDSYNSIKTEHSSEFIILKESLSQLKDENTELQNRLLDALKNKYVYEDAHLKNDFENLTKKLAQAESDEIAEKQRADHMSNLYKLVKEQLQKLEERLHELEVYNQQIVKSNVSLQENIKELENKLINYVDEEEYSNLKLKYSQLKEEVQKSLFENESLKNELAVVKASSLGQQSSSNDVEILYLKHQILDLQSNGDDKALIARLSSEVIHARLSETQCRKKLENLEMELKECQDNYDSCKDLLRQEEVEKQCIYTKFEKRSNLLEAIIKHQRQQYLGSIPLVSKEMFIANLQQTMKDKKSAFQTFLNALKQEHESKTLKEQLNKQISLDADFKIDMQENERLNVLERIKSWQKDRNIMLIKALKCQRDVDFKDMQIEQLSYRLTSQDEFITKLQEELFQCYQKYDLSSFSAEKTEPDTISEKTPEPVQVESGDIKLYKQEETQTTPELSKSLSDEGNVAIIIANLQAKLNSFSNELKEKNETIEQLKSKVTELEMNISLFRSQIGDKQSQIVFYEKHILELQSKINKIYSEQPAPVDYNAVVVASNNEEIIALKDSLKKVQELTVQKDENIIKYQTLLKNDRDEHSLAAARTQQEMKRLQEIISNQDKAIKELKETSIPHPGKAAIEQYILQVHALEKHTADLHTTVSTLNSQLQASRQEAARWQVLANERLNSIEELHNNLDEQHQNEIIVYKKEAEKWREEISKLKDMISKRRNYVVSLEPDLTKKLKEKDERIHELSVSLKNMKNEVKKQAEKLELITSPKVTELESANEHFLKDYAVLKKQCEQILIRERNAKEEIRSLKEQLLKRPITAKSNKSDKEQQLNKKVNQLEKENEDLRSKLEKEIVIHETHKIAVAEDFEKWKKQKHFQQLSEKLKNKLNEKTEEYEKLNQTCASYRILIERLEREKHTLESRIKALRSNNANTDSRQLEILNLENEKLHFEIEALTAKLQMQHYTPRGFTTTALQEKIEAQERKIAFLELSCKGNAEIRAELERLQNTNESLQKINLRLGAENLDLKLDLEKFSCETPHLREQIHHLENYIGILKEENQAQHIVAESGDHVVMNKGDKKVAELERTVFVLKRVVEKLQVENKRLLSGSSKPCLSMSEKLGSDKVKVEYLHLKDQYGESVQAIARLEDQLKIANNRIAVLEKRPLATEIRSLTGELTNVKNELSKKTEIISKVKVLLHRAATKEKSLLNEIAALKSGIPPEASTQGSSSV